MKTLKQFLTEAKQVGTLYHYTHPNSLNDILSSNKMYDRNSDNEGHVSFTRNKNFHKESRRSIPTHVSLELDGNKMSQHHKINPFHDRGIEGAWDWKKKKVEHIYDKKGMKENNG